MESSEYSHMKNMTRKKNFYLPVRNPLQNLTFLKPASSQGEDMMADVGLFGLYVC